MRLTDSILIRGEPDRIYELAADIAAWPRILPHYRFVRIIERDDQGVLAYMGVTRDGIPVSWRARQRLVPEERRVLFKHVAGITRGMDVEWSIAQEGGAVRVAITHDLTYGLPVLGPLFARYVVGGLFIHNIAGKTLRCIKRLAEDEARQGAASS